MLLCVVIKFLLPGAFHVLNSICMTKQLRNPCFELFPVGNRAGELQPTYCPCRASHNAWGLKFFISFCFHIKCGWQKWCSIKDETLYGELIISRSIMHKVMQKSEQTIFLAREYHFLGFYIVHGHGSVIYLYVDHLTKPKSLIRKYL